MKKEIKIAVLEITPIEMLMMQAVCAYFEMEQERLIAKSNDRELVRRKGLLFYLLKTECSLTDKDVAVICKTTRQNVAYHSGKVDVRKGLYLQSACDYRNIKAIFSHLCIEQSKWLETHKHSQ